jgi:hypothetical protein
MRVAWPVAVQLVAIVEPKVRHVLSSVKRCMLHSNVRVVPPQAVPYALQCVTALSAAIIAEC